MTIPVRWLPFAATLAFASACRISPQPGRAAPACCGTEGMRVAERYRVTAIEHRRFTHADFWTAMVPALRSPTLRMTEVGRSLQGRPIRAITFGRGPVTVLLWSQMHGDESTATMALADIVAWMADASGSDPLRDRIGSDLTVVMVPMLNPDGAELFQRQNAIGIDVNRDARRLATPEARALKALRDSIRPAFGFNLHDQNARTLSGPRGSQVAIALLAPAANPERTWGTVRTRARHVAAVIAESLEPYLAGRIAKYDDTFEPRAFGDLMQQWGTSTVLIESGALPGDAEKRRLRALNVVAILSALDAIATERYERTPVAAYDVLATNARSALDLLVRGGSIVLPGAAPLRADVAINYDEPLSGKNPRIREIGDLEAVVALDTIDATDLFLHVAPASLTEQGAQRWLRIGSPATITIRRTADPSSESVRMIGGQ